MVRRHIPALDGLRGLAALAVVWLHFWHFVPETVHAALLRRTAVFGQSGVDLFFVLSGYLITRGLLASKGQDGYFRTFYAKRALRIMPLYLGTLAAVYWLAPALGLAQWVPWHEQLWFWCYGQNLSMTFGVPAHGPAHFWSLAVEEHFYLAWPLLVWTLDRKKLARACLALVALALLTRWAMLAYTPYGVFYFTLCRVDGLAMGALLSLYEGHPVSSRKMAVGATALAVGLLGVWLVAGGQHAAWVQVVKFTGMALVFAALIRWATTAGPRWQAVLGHGVPAFLGTISYGVYVLHVFILEAIPARWYGEAPALTFLFALAATLAAASLSYYGVERRVLALKRYLVPSPVLSTHARFLRPAPDAPL